jgi:glycosyltransferase involved in cell wall biosynthesis
MKIAYLSASLVPSKTANSVHVMKMCQAFAKEGHDVTLYARESGEKVEGEYKYYGVDECFDIEKFSWPPVRGIGGLLYGKKIKKHFLNNTKPDIVYGRDLYSLLEAASVTNAEIYYEAHTPPYNRFNKRREQKLFSHKNFTRLVVISDALKKEYLLQFPKLTEDQIFTAHDGADLPDLHRRKEQRQLQGESPVNIGYVGHLYAGKGMEVIEAAAPHLPDYSFHIIGGKTEDIDYWRKKVSSENVYFYGHVSHGELDQFYHQFDIVLAPYQKKVETAGGGDDIGRWMSPLKIFEYMANEKAIISSNLPVIKEVLIDETNSLLCEPEDTQAWVDAIRRLAEDSRLKEKLEKNAYNTFIAKYTWRQRGRDVLA